MPTEAKPKMDFFRETMNEIKRCREVQNRYQAENKISKVLVIDGRIDAALSAMKRLLDCYHDLLLIE